MKIFRIAKNFIPEIFFENFRDKIFACRRKFYSHFAPYGAKWGNFSPVGEKFRKIFRKAKNFAENFSLREKFYSILAILAKIGEFCANAQN